MYNPFSRSLYIVVSTTEIHVCWHEKKVHHKPLFTSEGRETISAAVQLVYIFCYVISAMMVHFKSLNMPHKGGQNWF